jgi:hypothetical protein
VAATVKAPAPRARPARRPREIPAPLAETGVLRLSSASSEPEEREPLFYIDDECFTIPVSPPASIGLEAMHMTARGGMAAAAATEDYIMSEMLGDEGWAALRACKTLKLADYRRLVQVCMEKAVGPQEDDAPNR